MWISMGSIVRSQGKIIKHTFRVSFIFFRRSAIVPRISYTPASVMFVAKKQVRGSWGPLMEYIFSVFPNYTLSICWQLARTQILRKTSLRYLCLDLVFYIPKVIQKILVTFLIFKSAILNEYFYFCIKTSEYMLLHTEIMHPIGIYSTYSIFFGLEAC
jgi:hypothetical protein